MKKLIATTLFAVFASAFTIQPSFAVEVDVLVLYDNQLDAHYDGSPNTAITSMVSTANTYLRNSNVDVQLNLVGPIQYELGNNNETLTKLMERDDVQTLREALHADIVTYVSGSASNSEGFRTANSDFFFNIVKREDMTRSFTHEIGHNFGLGHALILPFNSGLGVAPYFYGTGYGKEEVFSTMMAYLSHYDSPARTFRFSNPDYNCSGETCGIEDEADAARAMNNRKNDVANARDSAVLISMRKRNAQSYALDGKGGGANDQETHLWTYSARAANQQFEQLDRGRGFYSFRKRNTNHCLDGGRGGENGQAVVLYECNATNQNQHWLKVKIGSKVNGLNSWRLQKRNASGYSIDGGRGASRGQGIYLWDSNDDNQNQQWLFARES